MGWRRRTIDTGSVDGEAVSEAIRAILVAEGVFGVTPEAVAARSGSSAAKVSAGVDLEAAVVEAYRDVAQAEVAQVRRSILAHPSAAVQMRELLSWLAVPPEESDALRLEMWALSRRNPALREVVRELEETWHGLVSGVIRRGARGGDFPQADADEIAAHLISVVDGANNSELIGYREQADRLRLLTRVVRAELGIDWGPERDGTVG